MSHTARAVAAWSIAAASTSWSVRVSAPPTITDSPPTRSKPARAHQPRAGLCRPGSAGSRAEVDRLHLELQRIGATIVTPPREYPEYTPPGYYAVFFKDPDGIKYEVVHAPS